MDNTQNMQNDVIDIRELFFVLKKRKKLIWLITTLITLFALVYTFIATPVYKATATILIGGQTKEGLFDNARNLKKLLDIKYDTSNEYKESNNTNYLHDIKIPKDIPGYITLTAYGNNNTLAKKALSSPIAFILDTHEIHYNSIIKQKREQIQLLKKKLSDIEANTIPQLERRVAMSQTALESKYNLLEALREDRKKVITNDPAFVTLIDSQMANIHLENLEERIINYEEKLIQMKTVGIPQLTLEIVQLKSTMSTPYIKRSHIIGKIYTHKSAIKPKKPLIIVVALITGLMFSIFLAFFLEFLQGIKEEKGK